MCYIFLLNVSWSLSLSLLSANAVKKLEAKSQAKHELLEIKRMEIKT
jgi:hypothetical protein